MHMLQNHPISLDKTRPQDFVPHDKIIKGAYETMLVQRPLKP
jgi:hypothetical protein